MEIDPTRPDSEEDSLARELDLWEGSLASGERSSLVDLINRVLDKGVVVTGEVTISIAGVDLVYLGLNAVLTSVSAARRRALAAFPDGELVPEESESGGE